MLRKVFKLWVELEIALEDETELLAVVVVWEFVDFEELAAEIYKEPELEKEERDVDRAEAWATVDKVADEGLAVSTSLVALELTAEEEPKRAFCVEIMDVVCEAVGGVVIIDRDESVLIVDIGIHVPIWVTIADPVRESKE